MWPILPACFARPGAAQGPSSQPSDGSKVAEELVRVFEADRYQTALPGAAESYPAWSIDIRWLGTVILVLLAATALFLGLQWLLRTLRSDGESRHFSLSGGEGGASLPMLEDPDELARRGLFAEAVHALLVNAIALLRQEEQEGVTPSLTSRELLGRLQLSGERLEALRYLVAKVEISIFGGRDLDRDEYVAARGRFRELHPRREA